MRRPFVVLLLCHLAAEYCCRNAAPAQKGAAPLSDLGTDVIEIANTRDNGLPPYLEEEPSEQDILDDTQDDPDSKPADTTKAKPEKASPAAVQRVADTVTEENEESLAKKFDAFYKDNDDKKDQSENAVTEAENQTEDNGRRTFQPDLKNKNLIEQYRTSQDSGSCKSANPLSAGVSSEAAIVELAGPMLLAIALFVSRKMSHI